MQRIAKMLAQCGIALGVFLLVLGLLARLWPALDLVNDGMPFIAVGTLVVLALAVTTKDVRLIMLAGAVAFTAFLSLLAPLRTGAGEAPPGSPRFLRIATFNIWGGNDRVDDIVSFLLKTDADVVVLQEVRERQAGKLFAALAPRYPNRSGDIGLVIFSKFKIDGEGRIDRPVGNWWRTPIVRFVDLNVNGVPVAIAGVHFARPFYPDQQMADLSALTSFARNATRPLIIAGDFNLTPWTTKLARFTATTRLLRYNTFHFTWPLRVRGISLLPFVATDNVFASPIFASIALQTGPDLGSDHRPVIADIALVGARAD